MYGNFGWVGCVCDEMGLDMMMESMGWDKMGWVGLGLGWERIEWD